MVSGTATPPPVAETAGEHLVLRVCGTTRDGQVVRLKSAKCTIGSGPRCTLRLRARGVQPVHCLIVRGSAGSVIRRWSADTRLNGRAFTDAELVDGDRLSVGAIELEVLESGRLPSPDPAESPEASLPQPPGPQVCGPSRLDLRRIDRLTARLRLANRQGRQRTRRLLEKLRAANREVAQFRESRAERPELERQLNEQAEAINARTSDLDLQQEAFERERRECQAKLAETEEQLRQRGERLDADQAELKAQQEEFERHRRRRWGVCADAIPAHRAETERAAIASQREQEEPPTDSERPQQPEPQEAPSEGPIDISDVFRRMRSGGLPSDEEPCPEPSAEPEPQPSEIPAAEEPSPAPQAAEDSGEESIEDYMSRLMDRVHGIRGDVEREERRPEESPPPQSPPPQSLPEQPVEPEPQVAAEAPRPEGPPAPQFAAPPRHPAEMAPRATAPEKPGSLSVMRELANLSAHNAIDRHARRQAKLASFGKLLVVAAGLAVGTLLLWIWWTTATSEVTFYAAMVSFVVALLWGFRCFGLVGRKRPRHSSRLEGKPGLNSEGDVGQAPGRGQEASYSGGSDRPLDDSTQDLEHELRTLIDAWPRK